MNVDEVKSKKIRLERDIRKLVEVFEEETLTTVKTIYTYPSRKGQNDRIETEIQIETFYVRMKEAA